MAKVMYRKSSRRTLSVTYPTQRQSKRQHRQHLDGSKIELSAYFLIKYNVTWKRRYITCFIFLAVMYMYKSSMIRQDFRL